MNYVKTFLLAVFILSCASVAFAETITMTTYYPSPSGNYNNINVTGSLIFVGTPGYFAGISGNNLYLNTGVAANAATGIVISNTGNIGIKKIPGVALDVSGAMTATGLITGGSLTITGASTLQAVTAGVVSATTLTASGLITGNSLTITAGASSLRAVTATTLTTTGNVTVNGALTASGNITTGGMFLHSSDERLKENIVPITGAIEKVKAINGVYFNYIGKEEKKMGVIAQNVEKVAPEVVSTDKDGMKSVDYSNLVALLIEAVKEQQLVIDDLKATVERNRIGR